MWAPQPHKPDTVNICKTLSCNDNSIYLPRLRLLSPIDYRNVLEYEIEKKFLGCQYLRRLLLFGLHALFDDVSLIHNSMGFSIYTTVRRFSRRRLTQNPNLNHGISHHNEHLERLLQTRHSITRLYVAVVSV
jgi:hypothetical protein